MPKVDNKTAHLQRFAMLRATRDLRTAAFDMVGGGDYEMVGFSESLLLNTYAPVPFNGLLVDIGCGPGRLARYLKDRLDLRYVGTDIVRELLEVAASECNRNDWTFAYTDGFEIPLENGSADVVAIFSVFTNIYPEESFLLLREAARVLQTGGKALISYFDMEVPGHRKTFLNLVEHQKKRIDPLVFLDRQYVEFFAAENRFKNLKFIRPEEIHIYSEPGSKLQDGREVSTGVGFSQMICVMERE